MFDSGLANNLKSERPDRFSQETSEVQQYLVKNSPCFFCHAVVWVFKLASVHGKCWLPSYFTIFLAFK